MKLLLAVLTLLLPLVATSCAGTPTPDIEATVAAAVAATQTAAPTNTPTPEPTDTPKPTDTPTPEPTDTPTPEPTDTPTPKPTNTPTPSSSLTGAVSMLETKLETGETRYELPTENFSVVLPSDWQPVDLDKMDFPEALETMGEQNENLKGIFSSSFMQNLVAAGMKFYAINLNEKSVKSVVPATINILKQELPVKFTLEQYTSLNVSQLEQFFDLTSPVKQEQLTFGDIEAAKISYSAKIVDRLGRNIEISNVQYMVLEGKTAYVITLSMPVELAKNNLEPFSKAVETFRLIE